MSKRRGRLASLRLSSRSMQRRTLAHKLFAAARDLYEGAPWRHVSGATLIRIDVPALDVEGACLSVIGNAHGDRGFAVFPSIDAYDDFAAAMAGVPDMRDCRDFKTPWLHLLYVPMAFCPRDVRRAIRDLDLPIANENAVPSIQSTGRFGLHLPMSETEMKLMGACAGLLGRFLNFLDGDRNPLAAIPVSIQLEHEDFPPVCFTFPYEAKAIFVRPTVNAEGHAWAVTVERYAFASANRAEVERLLRTLPELRDDVPEEDAGHLFMLVRGRPATSRELRHSLIGSVEINEDELVVTADSVQRAQEARSLIEGAARAVLCYIGRDVAEEVEPCPDCGCAWGG
ncbi:MAG TPA: hypothetical protein VEL28_14515 [Candidatus Binatia bacterium]|nr:hypothetical protein [Candidatus Binatia bacterium]